MVGFSNWDPTLHFCVLRTPLRTIWLTPSLNPPFFFFCSSGPFLLQSAWEHRHVKTKFCIFGTPARLYILNYFIFLHRMQFYFMLLCTKLSYIVHLLLNLDTLTSTLSFKLRILEPVFYVQFLFAMPSSHILIASILGYNGPWYCVRQHRCVVFVAKQAQSYLFHHSLVLLSRLTLSSLLIDFGLQLRSVFTIVRSVFFRYGGMIYSFLRVSLRIE